VPEIPQQEQRAARQRFVFDRHQRDVKVEQCRDQINQEGDEDGQFRRGDHGGDVHGVHNHVGGGGRDQHAASHGAQDDGGHGQTLHPAVCPYQSFRRQIFGEDAVLGGRVGRRTETGHAIGEQGIDADQHRQTARHLDRIADQHHATLGQRVGEGADEGREEDERENERLLQHRRVPAWGVNLFEESNSGEQQGIVGERGKELRRKDDVKAAFHVLSAEANVRSTLKNVLYSGRNQKNCAARMM